MRAKFTVTSIEEFATNKCARLMPVYGTEGENADYSKYTPSGKLEITIDKGTPAADFLKVGGNYYLDFSEAN